MARREYKNIVSSMLSSAASSIKSVSARTAFYLPDALCSILRPVERLRNCAASALRVVPPASCALCGILPPAHLKFVYILDAAQDAERWSGRWRER